MSRSLVASLIALSLIAATAVPTTAASPAVEYRLAMEPFLPEVQGWAGEVEVALRTAAASPKFVLDGRIADLAVRGRSIEDDVRGTQRSAPTTHRGAHASLTRSVEALNDALDAYAADPEAAALAAATSKASLDRSASRIDGLLRRIR